MTEIMELANSERECWIANPVGVFSTKRGLVQMVGHSLSGDEYRSQGWHEIQHPIINGYSNSAVRCVHAENIFDSMDDALQCHYARAARYSSGPGLVPLGGRAEVFA